MKVAEALRTVYTEIPAILKAAGLVDGETLSSDIDIEVTSAVLFWKNQVKRKKASSKETYVTWNLISTSAKESADNQVHRRELYVAVDIFTRRDEANQAIQDLITSIENACGDQWSLTLKDIQYEQETGLTHLPLDLIKS